MLPDAEGISGVGQEVLHGDSSSSDVGGGIVGGVVTALVHLNGYCVSFPSLTYNVLVSVNGGNTVVTVWLVPFVTDFLGIDDDGPNIEGHAGRGMAGVLDSLSHGDLLCAGNDLTISIRGGVGGCTWLLLSMAVSRTE